MKRSKLNHIPLDKIAWDWRVRTDAALTEDFIESIREKGIIQPISVTTLPDGRYKLIAGERRTRGAKEAGLTEIPAIIREPSDSVDELEVELIENIHRKDFHFLEEARGIQKLHELCKAKNVDWSGRKTAAFLQRPTMSVARALQLAEAAEVLPELEECKTQDEALRMVKAAGEQIILEEIRARQNKAISRGINDLLKIADANYRIGDAFDGLRKLPDNGPWNLLEVDPPYAIDLHENKKSAEGDEEYNEVSPKLYKEWLTLLGKETFRVANPHSWMIFWYGPSWHTEVLAALREGGWSVDEIPAIWVKPTGQTRQPEINLARAYEPFFICRKGKPVLVKRGHRNIFEYSHTKNKYHPTQRPLNMMVDLLDIFCVPSQRVLIPFLGSGTTLRATYKCGLTGMGWDRSKKYKDLFMKAVEEDSYHLDDDKDEGEEE